MFDHAPFWEYVDIHNITPFPEWSMLSFSIASGRLHLVSVLVKNIKTKQGEGVIK